MLCGLSAGPEDPGISGASSELGVRVWGSGVAGGLTNLGTLYDSARVARTNLRSSVETANVGIALLYNRPENGVSFRGPHS